MAKFDVTARSRWAALICYCAPHLIDRRLRELVEGGDIRFFAYILHDKDVTEDGKIKMPHTHIVVNSTTPLRERAFRNLFAGLDGDQNTLGNVILRDYVRDRLRYLTHEDEGKEKHHYSVDEVVTSDLHTFHKLSADFVNGENEKWLNVLDDVMQCDRREFARRYGRDGILNYYRYLEFACAMRGVDVDKYMANRIAADIYTLKMRKERKKYESKS